VSLHLVPVTGDQALAWIDQHHRHHGRPPGYRFAVGVAADDVMVGVVLAGRPTSRELQKQGFWEITRVATDGTFNACSMLYGAGWRAALVFGYKRAVTYTQEGESGASLRASGWKLDAVLEPRSGWKSRPGRTDAGAGVERYRWIKAVTA